MQHLTFRTYYSRDEAPEIEYDVYEAESVFVDVGLKTFSKSVFVSTFNVPLTFPDSSAFSVEVFTVNPKLVTHLVDKAVECFSFQTALQTSAFNRTVETFNFSITADLKTIDKQVSSHHVDCNVNLKAFFKEVHSTKMRVPIRRYTGIDHTWQHTVWKHVTWTDWYSKVGIFSDRVD